MTDGHEQERKARTHRRATSKKLRNGTEKFHLVTLAGEPLTVKEWGNPLQGELFHFLGKVALQRVTTQRADIFTRTRSHTCTYNESISIIK